MSRIVSIAASLLLLFSCSSQPKFSENEKSQARLFIEVLELDNKSIRISNSRDPYTSITPADVDDMLDLKMQALTKAEQIPAAVLSKMNKDLPDNYEVYKRGLSLRIQNLKTGNVMAEIEGSKLLDEWQEWFNRNKKDIKIPKS